MSKTTKTPEARAAAIAADAGTAAYAAETLERATGRLLAPLSDTDVCDCAEGYAAGITCAECGCQHRKQWEAILEAAKVLEAIGCRARRSARVNLPTEEEGA